MTPMAEKFRPVTGNCLKMQLTKCTVPRNPGCVIHVLCHRIHEFIHFGLCALQSAIEILQKFSELGCAVYARKVILGKQIQ